MRAALIFIVAFAAILPTFLVGLNIFDEGFIVTGAKMAMAGQLPYRDFFSLYGPAQYYLVGSLFAVFGEDLIVSRVAHAAMVAALVPCVFALSATARQGDDRLPYIVATICLAVALTCRPNPGYPAIPATILLLISAMLIGRWALGFGRRELLLASTAIGVAATFRWDFGVVALIAAIATVVVLGFATRRSAVELVKLSLVAACPALLIAAAVYAPLLILADPARWYREVLHYSLFEFAEQRGIEFMRPTYWYIQAALENGSLVQLCKALFRIFFVATPLVLGLLTIGIAITQLRRGIGDRESRVALGQSIFLALVCLGLLNQMRVRPNLWQGFPAAVASLPLLPFVLPGLSQHARQIARTVALFAIPVVATSAASSVLFALDSTKYVPLNISGATSLRIEPGDGHYAKLISFLKTISTGEEVIYSGALDHSKLFLNDALVYFLAGRPSATRFVQMDPGIANTEASQRELRAALDGKRVRVLVLVELESGEENLSSRSNGIEILDRFIREHYCEVRRFGRYHVLVLRAPTDTLCKPVPV